MRRRGTKFLAELPAGTEVAVYNGRMYFAHPDHPVRYLDDAGNIAPVGMANAVREQAAKEK